MPKDFLKFRLADLDLSDAEALLKTLGTIVVDEISAMIEREEQPDGSPQKQNSEEYKKTKLRKKGYTKPLWGISGGARSIAYHRTHEGRGLNYIKQKPKVEGGESSGEISPYMSRPSTFERTIINIVSEDGGLDTGLEIKLNKKREEIGKKVTDLGYWFMGITNQAKIKMRERMVRYLRLKTRQLVRKNQSGG